MIEYRLHYTHKQEKKGDDVRSISINITEILIKKKSVKENLRYIDLQHSNLP